MCRLLETLKVLDGALHHPDYHNHRMHHSRRTLLGIHTPLDLAGHVQVPPEYRQGLYKCRVIYREHIEQVAFVPYQPPVIRTLKLVHDDAIDYAHKFENRESLTRLYARRESCDDILIVRNGRITDTSYANIVFSADGLRWFTPAQPLLTGTARQRLLESEQIAEADIDLNNLAAFRYFKIINALNDLDGATGLVNNIR